MKITKLLILISCIASSGFGVVYVKAPPGSIQNANVYYNNSTTVKLSPGFGEINGVYWEISPQDTLVTTGYALTGLRTTATGEFQYIYVDYANSPFPVPLLINSPTAPAWNDSKQGWYDGGNRCIGSVFVNASGSIVYFQYSEADTILCATKLLVSSGTVFTNYPATPADMNLASAAPYLPVNAIAARIEINCDLQQNTWAEVHTYADSSNTYFSHIGSAGYRKAVATGWLTFHQAASKGIRWYAWSSVSNNSTNLWIFGYKVKR
jgi:hypothetical protein